MPKTIREAGPLAIGATSSSTGTVPIVLITPGWGSSGYYSAKVLENAAKAKVFAKGMQLFLDHPGKEESYDRPERSVRDLAATLAEDAVWDGTQLVGEATPFGAAADMLANKEFAKTIGLSIRAYAESTIGEAEGRRGEIMTELVEAISTDFVTKAGRGGRVLVELMESARPEQVCERAVTRGVAEATANDTRTALSDALKDAYGGEKSWTWVRDFDETTVWFQHETPDWTGMFAETYEIDDDDAAVILAGSPVEVRATTVYVPVKPATESGAPNVPAPAGQPNPTPNVQEDTMGNIQVDEAQHAAVTEAAGRVPTLEAERDTAKAELAMFKAREAARPAVTKKVGESSLPATRKARIVESILKQVRLDENGQANAEELVTLTEAEVLESETEIAEIAESLGVGSIRGFGGGDPTAGTVTEADFDAAFNAPKEG